jgi:hypothetical protein
LTRAVGRGWATVELDRAEGEVCDAVGVDLRFAHAASSRLLGARCRRAATPDGEWIVLLEPDTEARLAAFLARHGEGWAVTWEVGDPTPPGTPGPVGPERLAPHQPVGGPFRLIVSTATIEP